MKPFRQIVTDITISVPCPYCFAPVNQRCSDRNGNMNIFSHEERIEQALKLQAEKLPPRGVWAGVDTRKKA